MQCAKLTEKGLVSVGVKMPIQEFIAVLFSKSIK
jgi:hypothetical protein